MKKLFALVLVIVCLAVPIWADSFSFYTAINSISNGLNGFGMGLFPLGTNYSFERYFKAVKGYKHDMKLYSRFEFVFNDNWVPDWYAYTDGTPRWSLTAKEYSDKSSEYVGGRLFNPRANIYTYLQQGLGENPVGGGPLVYLRAAWYTRYSMYLEYKQIDNGYGTVFIDPATGLSKAPFGSGTTLPGYPWLQDNHLAWNNHIELSAFWYLYKDISNNDTRNGVYAETTFEFGPSWLGNTISPKGVSSNFWRFYGYLEERLVLFSKKQDDGKNWASMYVGHYNAASYTGGDVVPEHMIPSDRLRGRFSDRIWLMFTGPQFVAGDCYSYIELALNNNLYFGHVVNETSNSTTAVELQSSVSVYFHLRLFGFIRFDYSCGYNFNRGLWTYNPGWYQGAQVSFYVSV